MQPDADSSDYRLLWITVKPQINDFSCGLDVIQHILDSVVHSVKVWKSYQSWIV